MKDFFFFSKSQRRGTFILLLLIVVCIAGYYLLPLIFPAPKMEEDTDLSKFQEEVKLFEQSLEQEKTVKREYSNKYNSYDKISVKREEKSYSLFSFDPNLADSVDFIDLGLSPHITHNILKYRQKGGFFKSAEHFGETYGISPEKLRELQPYITISERKIEVADSVFVPKKVLKKDTILELNTADTTHLMLIKGIGRNYAVSIVGYKKQLGGFYSVEQLREIQNMTEENYLQIQKSFTVNASLIVPINVNKASVAVLEKHPYITFTQAKEIYELRRMQFKLDNIQQLEKLDHISREDITRLTPYLTFLK